MGWGKIKSFLSELLERDLSLPLVFRTEVMDFLRYNLGPKRISVTVSAIEVSTK